MNLSDRELQVAELVMKGMSNTEISRQLLIKEKSVKGHITNIYKKYEVKSRAQFLVKTLTTEVGG